MELYITQEGRTFSGKPCIWLDTDEVNDQGEIINQYGKVTEEGEHFAGFFSSEDEARTWAKEHGHNVIE